MARLFRSMSAHIRKLPQDMLDGRIVFIAILTLVIISCSGNSEEELVASVPPTISDTPVVENQTPVDSPTSTAIPLVQSPKPISTSTVEPTTTPTPSVAPTRSSGVKLPAYAIEDVDIGSCRLTGRLSASGELKGTAPAPTPTAVAKGDDRGSDVVLVEVSEFSRHLLPIMESVEGHQSAFQSNWYWANDTDMQAAQLLVLGSRVSQLCSALNLISVPPEIFNATFNLADSLRVTHNWALTALDELACCGDAHSPFISTGYDSTFDLLTHVTDDMRMQLFRIIEGTYIEPGRTVTNDTFGISIKIDQDAILIQNSVFLLAGWSNVSDVLDPDSLGPMNWGNGDALNIKRIRNRSDLTVQDAVVQYEGLLMKFGEISGSRERTVSGMDAIELSYATEEESWQASVILVVHEGFIYFIELMCRPEQPESCDAIQTSIDSIAVLQ